ncbi:SRPBCC family protein [Acaryochloris marina]|nr:SRPBCC family protein [Acaryochloris marina]BDM79768.1 hypothetical protein AM10699_26360 [Acaryochloris marina MBIC10699]
MGKVYVEVQIPAPTSDVWNVLANYGEIYKFNPGVANSFILDGSVAKGVGAHRRCDLSDGKNHVLERVTHWKEGESYTVDIYDGTMPLRTAQARLGVRSNTGATSVAFMEMEYVPKFGVIGRLMDALMMQREMHKLGRRVLSGLAEFVTSNSGASYISKAGQ